MKFGVVAAIVATLFAGTAAAADLPVRMPVKAAPYVSAYDWTGFYVGLHAGYGWGRSDWSPVPFVFQGAHDMDGGLIGGQIGYNWHTGPMVLGVELDGSWADIQGSHVDPTNTLLETRIRTLGTLAGRIGYAFSNVLLYAKGGGAAGDFKYNDSFGGVLNGAESETRLGWMGGVGLEYGFTRNWTAKIEYNYIDFGSDAFTFTGGVAPAFIENIDSHLHIVKGGVNYRF